MNELRTLSSDELHRVDGGMIGFGMSIALQAAIDYTVREAAAAACAENGDEESCFFGSDDE